MNNSSINKSNKSAFTLVELIVVITILAILWTIAFMSFRWYNSNSRDSVRISDISNVITSMELYELEAWKYPIPSNWINVTYSWATVWNQWTLWKSVFTNVSKLDKIPKDPLLDKEYTYSVSQNGTEYEVSWIIEGDEDKVKAMVSGNYNGIVSKVVSWNNCNILVVPSIISSDLDYSTDFVELHDNWWLVYNWYNNLPSSYKNTKLFMFWGFDFLSDNLLVYSNNDKCEELFSSSNSATLEKVSLLKWIQDSYSNTILYKEWEISNIIDLNIDENNPSNEVNNYSINFVNNLNK